MVATGEDFKRVEASIDNQRESSNGGGCRTGCLVLGTLALALIMPLVIWYFVDIHGQQSLHVTDERFFDPIEGYSQASRLVDKEVEFVEMNARFVRPDGTMNLAAEYAPTVIYRWRKSERSLEQRPIGAGAERQPFEVVDVRVNDFGPEETERVGNSTFYRFDLGFRRVERTIPAAGELSVAEPPECSLSTLWKHALDGGAPENAVATIHYDASGYLFRIDGQGFSMRFDSACNPR